MAEEKQAPILNLTTGQGPELEISISSTAGEDGRVFNGQYVRYYVEVKNTGDLEATNAKLNIDLPNQATFVSYQEGVNIMDLTDATTQSIELGTIKPGETKEASFEIQANGHTETPEEDAPEQTEKIINLVVKVAADNIDGEIKSNEYDLKVEDIGIQPALVAFEYDVEGFVLAVCITPHQLFVGKALECVHRFSPLIRKRRVCR